MELQIKIIKFLEEFLEEELEVTIELSMDSKLFGGGGHRNSAGYCKPGFHNSLI